MSESRKEIRDILDKVQNYDASKLGRREALGEAFSFEEAQQEAQNLIEFLGHIPLDLIASLPQNQANQVKNVCELTLKTFEAIQKFDPQTENAANQRNQLIAEVQKHHQNAFSNLTAVLSFVAARTPNIKKLEDALSNAETIVGELTQKNKDAEEVLSNVRQAAAEQGVSQEARVRTH